MSKCSSTVFTVNGRVGLVDDGRTLASPQTLMMSGACPQPVHSRPMFGSFGRALSTGSVSFVSQAAIERDVRGQYGLAKETVAVRDTRGGIGKRSMRLNGLTPKITVDPETYAVTAVGRLLTCEPAKVVAMAQRYFLF